MKTKKAIKEKRDLWEVRQRFERLYRTDSILPFVVRARSPELGIRPDHMLKKTLCVMIPFRDVPAELADDSDMAGPIAICLALGFLLILSVRRLSQSVL